jgi:hypothetical protein
MADTVYRTRLEIPKNPDTLVIHCTDPFFQVHFQEFLHQHLGLESYSLIAVPGGPQFLTMVEYLPKFAWVGWRWLKFLTDVIQPARVVLIAHEGCRWYGDGRIAALGSGDRNHALRDLERVKGDIAGRFGKVRIETYMARVEGEHVAFEKM